MGLFDFIKKKLFGKTKKVEESQKIKEEKKNIKSEVVEKTKKPQIKVEKSKELKKGFFTKIKEAIIDSPKKGKEEPVVEEVKEEPVVEEVKEEPVVEEVKEEPVVEEVKEEPVVEEVKEEPVVEEVKEEPVVEEVKEEPVVEEVKEEPVVEEVKEEPVVEEVKEEPVVEEVKEEPVVEEVKEEPVVEEVKEEPVVEEVKEEPVVEEVKEEPVVEEVKEEPVVEEVKEEPVVEEVKEEPVVQETLNKGLEKTKKTFFSKLKSAIIGKSKIDDQVLDDLEEVLITSDVGVKTTIKIIERIEDRVAKEKYTSVNELNKILKDEIVQLLSENNSDLNAFDVSEDKVPYVILIVGVNGVGKTTTIGKLAAQFKAGGLKVLLGAADTFRAAAVDQLLLWGEKVGVDVVSHGMNTDPASVAYDTVKKAVKENYDVVIIDTAGRLHTKVNLMNELSKIKRVIQKFKEDAPHEVMLILDGSTGQNAFVQAEEFTKVTDVNSITITKLDGTAKGGVVIGITDQFKIPIKYVGVGEKIGDLQLFHKGEFVNSFFD